MYKNCCTKEVAAKSGESNMTKIDIFSGFLGAGKTTLIKKLLKEAYVGEQVVLIENEFGEIGIDGGFLQDAGVKINEMNSGCICCSLVGDFRKALSQVLTDYHPDRILIEPSGVGKLSDVIRAVRGVESEEAVLNCFTTVVDAGKCKMYMKNFGEFYNDQIGHASAIVLSHTTGASDAKVAECVALLREHNADAAIITTPWEDLDGKDILAAMEKKDTLGEVLAALAKEESEHHHDDDDDEDEHEHCCHHQDDDDEDGHEHCCHHHDGDDEDEHEHCHHHDDDEDEHEHCCHHHDEDEDDEHEHHHDGHCCHHHHHHGHDADEVFTSVGYETTKKYTEDEITSILTAFVDDATYGTVLRAKGIVPAADGKWIHFDYVPGEPDVRFGSAIVTGRICVIGSSLDEEKIKKLFGV